MTNQHRATPEQWDLAAGAAADCSAIHACILELRARVEALESQYETQRLATLEWGKDVDNHGRWIDDHLKRIMALEATQHAHADTSRLSDDERRTVAEGISRPGRWQPLRTEVTYGEANAHAQSLVRHLSMDQPAPSQAVDRVRDLQDQIRDGSLTLAEALAEIGSPTPAPAPADSLVERVAGILVPDDPICARGTARAAIREVAAALIDWHDSDQVVRTAWEAGKWLEREAGK